jgi:hypothetical protein
MNTKVEQELFQIVQRLPQERVLEILDFAQFLESKIKTADTELGAESEGAISQGDTRWDALLASDESQRLLEKMADEALGEIQRGRAQSVTVTENDELAPE